VLWNRPSTMVGAYLLEVLLLIVRKRRVGGGFSVSCSPTFF